MAKKINLNNEIFQVESNEYLQTQNRFTKLKIFDNLGFDERLISFISEISSYFEKKLNNKINLIIQNTIRGGYVPIKLSDNFKNIFLIETEESHNKNIIFNINYYKISNIHDENIEILNLKILKKKIIILNNISNININLFKTNLKDDIIISENIELNHIYKYKFLLKNSNINIYTNNNIEILEIFKYYIENNSVINYDNLINLCVMVKNGGSQFENFLIKNLELIDEWTILDTGSTDNTIQIIKNILVGKKRGNLYQEPFINFKDSRNRLLDLAGDKCKFILMLDDTYIVEGNLRDFLIFVRGDQYSSSFTLFINSYDTQYCSNRIIKTKSKLRYIYKIHEIISDKNNIMVTIPYNISYITDLNFDYMEKRTKDRNEIDLKLLFEELEENPENPRTYFYLGQTYYQMYKYQESFDYYIKRSKIYNTGFIQERLSSLLRAAKIANFKLNKPWNECEELYLKSYQIDNTRPESLYFIGVHYYLINDFKKAFNYLKIAFKLGIPEDSQFDLVPIIYNHYIPKFLTKICYYNNDYQLGKESSEYFLLKNNNSQNDFHEINSWNLIFNKLNIYKEKKELLNYPDKPFFVFVFDGNLKTKTWTGSTSIKEIIGSTEIFIIQMAKYIQKLGIYNTIVFCNTPNKEEEIYENTIYRHLDFYYKFINTTYVSNCVINQSVEYLPLTLKGLTENVYLILHNLLHTGIIIPIDIKLKKIFCLTELHVEYFINLFKNFKNLTVSFNYGYDFISNNNLDIILDKIPYKFIFQSNQNKGLLELLIMWEKIYEKENRCTLYIYSDINNTDLELMDKIKILLNNYFKKPNNYGIFYYEQVTKLEIENAWKTSEYLLFLSTDKEIFCSSILKAAKNKTFIITNDLVYLQNTLSLNNMGIIIKDDVSLTMWQNMALEKLFYYFDEKNINEKNIIIEKNYMLVENITTEFGWKSQIKKIINNLDTTICLDYKNNFDIITKDDLYKINEYLNTNLKILNNQEIKILDIKTHTGINLINIINNINCNVSGYAIDDFKYYKIDNIIYLNNEDKYQLEKSFHNNIIKSNLKNNIYLIKTIPEDKLIEFINTNTKFDIILINKNHDFYETYNYLCLSWKIIEKKCIIIIWKDLENILNNFFNNHKNECKIIYLQNQIIIEKI